MTQEIDEALEIHDMSHEQFSRANKTHKEKYGRGYDESIVAAARHYRELKRLVDAGECKVVPSRPTGVMLIAMDEAIDMPDCPMNELDIEDFINEYVAATQAAPDIIKDIEGDK